MNTIDQQIANATEAYNNAVEARRNSERGMPRLEAAKRTFKLQREMNALVMKKYVTEFNNYCAFQRGFS